MFRVLTVAICILAFGVGYVIPDSEEDGYSGEVIALFDNLTAYSEEIEDAREKMESFQGHWDRKYAIAIINLYTQPSSFYTTLNREMRNDYPASVDTWKIAGDLINRALDILGLSFYRIVYRGCNALDVLPKVGKPYSFNQIISTSTNIAVAKRFACPKGFLFEMKNVFGVRVKLYSALPDEDEVILKSTNVFKVINDSNIENSFKVYQLDGQADCNGRRRKRGVNVVCHPNSAQQEGMGTVLHCVALIMFLLLLKI